MPYYTTVNAESHDVTQLLKRWQLGDDDAPARLIPLVYEELRQLAHNYIQPERADHRPPQATTPVHEAYLRMVDDKSLTWKDRAHFYGIAARLLRRILVEHARAHHAAKRGGSAIQVPLDEAIHGGARTEDLDLVTLNSALDRLEQMDPAQSRIVELRYFAGLTIEETAEALNISPATVKRSWTVARAWLKREISRVPD